MRHDEQIGETAIAWAVRTLDPDFADWEAFTAWLEQDPAHSRAYDAAVAAVEDAGDALSGADPTDLPVAANDDDGAAMPRRRWAMPALAALFAGLAALGAWQAMPGTETYRTAPGETRRIALADGSAITLAGGSKLELRGRRAELEQGRAFFDIVHDDSDAFVLVAADTTLVDVGTTFDVLLSKDRIAVEVGEGEVVVNPKSEAIQLAAGDKVVGAQGRWTRSSTMADQVGEWHQGRITFRAASLDAIAEQLSGTTGQSWRAENSRAAPPFTGSLDLGGIAADPESLAPLLGVTVRRDGRTMVLSPR